MREALNIYFSAKIQYELAKSDFRYKQLSACKTQEERDKLLDRWNIADAAERIADAIKSQPRYIERSKFLGIF